MSENSFFFTAVSGAPAYSADDIVKWLYDRLFHGEGVLKGLYNGLAVTSDGAGNASIATGCASKTGHGYYNDSVLSKALTLPAVGYTNVNTIVVRVDSSTSPNTMHVVVLVGTSVANGGTPTAPSITSGSDVYLADIKIVNTSGSYTYTVTDQRVYVPIISNGLLGTNWESELEKAIGSGLLAPLASPTFTGMPAAPTPAVGTNTTQIATASMVTAAVAAEASARSGADSTLQTNINAEASARSGADSTLQTNINAEASARSGADSAHAALTATNGVHGIASSWAAALSLPYWGPVAAAGDYIIPGFGSTPSTNTGVTYIQKTVVTSYHKVYEIKAPVSGTIRVHYSVGNQQLKNGYAKTYVNGSPVGSEVNVYNSIVDASDDITVVQGDLIQLYCYTADASAPIFYDCFSLCSSGYGVKWYGIQAGVPY